MIRLENIQRRYISDEVETTALADIDLHVAAGDARIEWADGGIVRERARIEAAVLDALGLPTGP